jgi:hypothetical protein
MDEELPPPPPELRNEINTKSHILGADDDPDSLPPPVSFYLSHTFFFSLSLKHKTDKLSPFIFCAVCLYKIHPCSLLPYFICPVFVTKSFFWDSGFVYLSLEDEIMVQ